MKNQIPQLDEIDHEIAELLIEGISEKTIAQLVGRSYGYVKQRISLLCDRFGVEDDATKRLQLALYLHAHREQFDLHCVACA